MKAIGDKTVTMNSGTCTGKVTKHVSKHGPLYIRVTTKVHDESFKLCYGKDFQGDEEADNSSGSDDDESFMVLSFCSEIRVGM